jgi:hypothetical protein
MARLREYQGKAILAANGFKIPRGKPAFTADEAMPIARDFESEVVVRRCLLPRIGFRDNQADRVLIESFEAAFALQILQMPHDRPSPQNAFIGWGFERKIAH